MQHSHGHETKAGAVDFSVEFTNAVNDTSFMSNDPVTRLRQQLHYIGSAKTQHKTAAERRSQSQSLQNTARDSVKEDELQSEPFQLYARVQDDISVNEGMYEGYTEFFSHGRDDKGQLGHAGSKEGTREPVSVPKSLSFDVLIDRVSCGGSHTLMLAKNGDLYCTGSNEFGQLGLNDRKLDYTPAPLLVLAFKTDKAKD